MKSGRYFHRLQLHNLNTKLQVSSDNRLKPSSPQWNILPSACASIGRTWNAGLGLISSQNKLKKINKSQTRLYHSTPQIHHPHNLKSISSVCSNTTGECQSLAPDLQQLPITNSTCIEAAEQTLTPTSLAQVWSLQDLWYICSLQTHVYSPFASFLSFPL